MILNNMGAGSAPLHLWLIIEPDQSLVYSDAIRHVYCDDDLPSLDGKCSYRLHCGFVGWVEFFLISSMMAVPGMLLLIWVSTEWW